MGSCDVVNECGGGVASGRHCSDCSTHIGDIAGMAGSKVKARERDQRAKAKSHKSISHLHFVKQILGGW